MKRFLLLVLALVLMSGTSAMAQGMLRRLGERAKEAVENNIGTKIEEGVNNILNGKSNDKSGNSSGNQGDVDEDVPMTASGAIDFEEIKAKSDFVRGANVFFSDDLKGEKLGEFPSKWDLLEGSEVEVVNITGEKAIRMESSRIMPLMEEKEYLPEEFTIEFDVLVQPAQEGSGWDGTLDLIMDGDGGQRVFDIRMSPEYHPYYGGEYNGIDWGWGAENPNGTKMSGAPGTQTIKRYLKKNEWNHIAFSFNKRHGGHRQPRLRAGT